MSFRLAGLLKVVRLPAVVWRVLQVLADVSMLPAVLPSDLDLCRRPQWLLEPVCVVLCVDCGYFSGE